VFHNRCLVREWGVNLGPYLKPWVSAPVNSIVSYLADEDVDWNILSREEFESTAT